MLTAVQTSLFVTEKQKLRLCYQLLNAKWENDEKIKYKGKEYRIGRTTNGDDPELEEEKVFLFRLETEKCHNMPETAEYTLGKDAWLVAEDDLDLFDWEVSKEILLAENPYFSNGVILRVKTELPKKKQLRKELNPR